MKKGVSIITVLSFFLISLTGCQQEVLKKTAETFILNNSEYEFNLPAGWELEPDYQTELNEAAVFGAEDTNSRSVMFIRGEAGNISSKEQLEEQTKKSITKYYKLEDAVIENFEVAGHPTIHYLLPSVYKKKAVWLDMYYVVTESNIVSFHFYRPKNNSSEKQQDVIKKAVESLKQISTGSTTSSEKKEKPLAISFTGYKVEGARLVIRYVLTNQGENSIKPTEEWQRLVTLEQENQKIAATTEQVKDDNDLAYLQTVGMKELAAGKSIECAAIYDLPAKEEVMLKFDPEIFDNKQPMRLTIKE